MSNSDNPGASIIEVAPNDAGQRIDNFLSRHLKGVPQDRIYRALRTGEVRVNGARKKPTYHIAIGDKVRIPPLRRQPQAAAAVIPAHILEQVPVLFEDRHIMVVNKPSGLAVHGGSGIQFGLIEALRQLRQDTPFLELAHRLDRDTSGCLMLAKSRTALVALHQQLSTARSIRKRYLALLQGQPRQARTAVTVALQQIRGHTGIKNKGIKRMIVDAGGQTASTEFVIRERYRDATLAQVNLHTGRMHQARVHAVALGNPIAGDRMYGDRDFNNVMRKRGLKRLFLHAERLTIQHPDSGNSQDFLAPLPAQLQQVLQTLERLEAGTTC